MRKLRFPIMWSFQSFPVLDGRHTCRGCQRLAKTQKQLFPLQYSTFFPRKVFFTCKLERKLCLPAPDRKVFCMVQTENVPDLAEERSYEILEEKHLPDSKVSSSWVKSMSNDISSCVSTYK